MPKKNYKVNVPEQILDSVTDVESELSLFDPENPDITLFNFVDDELIKLSGSKILYYKYHQVDQDFDDVYLEARNKPIAKESILVYGHYEPTVLEENLTQFGIELTNDQLFIFNKSYMDRMLSRSPIPGDIVEPKFQKQKYELFEVQEDSFEVYGVYHYVCAAKLLRDSPEIQDTPLTDTIDETGVY